ncbi:MAG: cysteine desulfurase [Patescibacteria group bacterium]|jgi:cysteine desulfurase/selenocysteine lyase
MNLEKTRQDFPILSDSKLIYFDNACTTLKPNSVIEAVSQFYREFPFCDRGSYKLSQVVGEKCEKVRQKTAKFINANNSNEVIFVKNATEGINFVANSFNFKAGDIVLTSDKEHNSNFLPWVRLAKHSKIQHLITKTASNGEFDLGDYKSQLEKNQGNIKLVSLVYTSNLDGVTYPVKEIVELAHKYNSLVLLDATQAATHRRIDVKKLGVDFLVFSAHKMLGPTGIGILYIKKEIIENFVSSVIGGGTVNSASYTDYELLPSPQRFEAGIQNYSGIFGFGAALDYINSIGMENIEKQNLILNKYITENLINLPNLRLIGPAEPKKRSGIISFYIEGADPHYIAQLLENSGNIAIRSGQLCVHPWFSDKEIKGVIRISTYFYNTLAEAETLIKQIKNIVRIL